VCVVHTWGNPAPMDPVMELAERHSLAVIEDCSHAHGARWRGRSVGSFGHVGCFSLQGSKAVEGGEAGVAVTDDPVLYDRMLLLGHNALVAREQQADTFPGFGDVSLGVKYRPHPAAMNFAYRSLKRLPERNRRAARAWRWLCAELAETAAIRPIEIPEDGERGGWYAFVFEYRGEELGGPDTEAFVEAVRAEGVPIDTDQFRGRLLHQLPLFTDLDRRQLGGGCWDPTRPWEENLCRQSLPVTEAVTQRLVRLTPQLWGLSESYVRRCAGAMRKVSQALVPASTEAGEAMAPRVSASPA
jgi:dTDP-4-amino-4,6-dideoxygalactose transaminase